MPPTRVHILGVEAPAGSSCYAKESAALARELALGKVATLVGDAKNGYYVSVAGTDDLGRALIGRGAAQLNPASGLFSRLESYVPLQEQATTGHQGMWGACTADVSTTMTGPESAFVGQEIKYTVVVANAGPMVADAVDVQVRPGAYRETLVSVSTASGSCTPSVWMAHCAINGIAPGGTATVTVVLRGSDFGALSGRAQASLVGCATVQCAGRSSIRTTSTTRPQR